ncbi:MAG: peroxiredoxin [uncultured archaeon A07HR60]|nr:MAG: peroxiredoxin [uncultured archaeon A07HR60]
MLEIGQSAPDFTLPNQHGEQVSLSAHDGFAVVYFFPRADTPGCTAEACSFRDKWESFAERDVSVFGISDDPVSDLDAFAADYDLQFHLLSDTDGDVSASYGSYGEKNIYGNTIEGVFRNSFVVDPNGDVALVYEGVDPQTHGQDILADLAELENN